MGWVRLDDNFADHPKIIALSDTAFRLFITGLCYSNRQLTDGLIPYRIVSAWVGDDPMKPSDELEDQNLWERVDKGFRIRSYEEYQPTRTVIEAKRERNKERLRRYREQKENANETVLQDRFSTDDETRLKRLPQPNPTQPNPNKDIKDNYYQDTDIVPYESSAVMPRVRSAKAAVTAIMDKLGEARTNGVNAWNLSILVQEQWDVLHANDDIGGCIALTVWYVSELQSRTLTSAEIGRIGQMTKRFGRIALLAIDEAAAKDLTDLVSYAFRIAQRMYADRKA